MRENERRRCRRHNGVGQTDRSGDSARQDRACPGARRHAHVVSEELRKEELARGSIEGQAVRAKQSTQNDAGIRGAVEFFDEAGVGSAGPIEVCAPGVGDKQPACNGVKGQVTGSHDVMVRVGLKEQ